MTTETKFVIRREKQPKWRYEYNTMEEAVAAAHNTWGFSPESIGKAYIEIVTTIKERIEL